MTNRIRPTLLAILLTVFIVSPAMAAETYDDARAAFSQRDYPTALRILRPLAAQGDAQAQNQLGIMHASGRGVSVDEAEAVKWYKLAAEQGLATAQYNLGLMYNNGRGVERDHVQAYKWVALAAARYSALDLDRRTAAETGRDILAAALTAEQLAEAKKLMNEWRPKQ